jgi:hypothetical protein
MAAEQRHTSNAMASFRVDQLQTKLPQPHTACCSLRTRGNKGRTRGQTARGARAGTVQREQRQRQQQRCMQIPQAGTVCIRHPGRFGFEQ